MAIVVLIAPSYVSMYREDQREAYKYFPIGLGYLASYLQKHGRHVVHLLDPDPQKLDDQAVIDAIRTIKPDLVGITSTTPTFPNAVRMAQMIRANVSARIIAGGVHVSALSEMTLRDYPDLFDCIVIGEGEQTLLDIVNAYETNASLDNIPGLAFRSSGSLVFTGRRPLPEELDSIPFPARDLLPQELYTPAGLKNSFSMMTSRGCPFNCNFCASRVLSGRKYRVHSAKYVLEEMRVLQKQYHARYLVILDDTFTVNRSRLEAICRGMIDDTMGLKWSCFSAVSAVDKDLLKLMQRAGCFAVCYGVESADETVLKRMGKPIDSQRSMEAIRMANEIGLLTYAYYLLGSPGETKAQMIKTLRFAAQARSTFAIFNKLIPYPGTKYFAEYTRQIPFEKIDWRTFVDSDERSLIEESDMSSKEITALVSQANRYYRTSRFEQLLSGACECPS